MGQLCKGHHYMDCVVRKQFILEWLHSGFMCIFHSVSVWYHFPHKVFIQFIQHLSDWHQNSHIAVSLSVFFDASTGVSNVKNAQIRHKVKWLCLKGTSHTHYHIFTQILFGEILERVKLLLCFICSIIANWHAPASPVSQLQPNTSTWHSWQFASLRSKNCQTARVFLHRESVVSCQKHSCLMGVQVVWEWVAGKLQSRLPFTTWRVDGRRFWYNGKDQSGSC